MGNLRISFVLASALVALPLAGANAADLTPEPMPVPVPAPVPVSECCGGEFYVKSFIGFSNQEVDGFTNDVIEDGDFTIVHHEFDSAPFLGLGIGYRHSERFRFDATGEYRGKASFRGLDTYVDLGCGPGVCTNEHTGYKSEWLFLANGYWDIGTFRGITPFVGAGVGVANVKLHDFWDVNLVTNGLHWAEHNDEWNFAWALHAGLAYQVNSKLTVDVAYRYVNLGDGITGAYETYDPAAISPGPTTLDDLDSHDLMVGFRWKLGDDCCQQTAYVPQPTYMPQPYK